MTDKTMYAYDLFRVILFTPLQLSFIEDVYRENLDSLHGSPISFSEWKEALCTTHDPDEQHFIITMNGHEAAWMKLNGMACEDPYISMLVVKKSFQHMGVGRFAVKEAERYVMARGKTELRIKTTADNAAAIACYQNCGYDVEKQMSMVCGDNIVRNGFRFLKILE